jgi:hypothetical protein
MPSLLVLAVAFAGVGGPKATKVEAQVRKVLSAETDVVDASLTPSSGTSSSPTAPAPATCSRSSTSPR